jgi:16S rRNA (cytidine1402-2'-O)-methyltransferase
MPGILYVVATPIGNLEDVSLRALRVLKEADLIAAEDTRVTRKLLSRFDIHTPLTSCHRHTREEKTQSLAARLAEGQTIALVSDAGTPGISDPGSELIAEALANSAQVVPIPGPNAALAALVVSGLPAGRFAFDGFPPRTKGDRREFFDNLREERRTVVLYESPGRLVSTLEELHLVLGDRPVAVARELTKVFEEVYRGTLAGAAARFRERRPRGEFTLVIGPAPRPHPRPLSLKGRGEEEVRQALRAALEAGATPRDAVRQTAGRLRLPRRCVYNLLLEMTGPENKDVES